MRGGAVWLLLDEVSDKFWLESGVDDVALPMISQFVHEQSCERRVVVSGLRSRDMSEDTCYVRRQDARKRLGE